MPFAMTLFTLEKQTMPLSDWVLLKVGVHEYAADKISNGWSFSLDILQNSRTMSDVTCLYRRMTSVYGKLYLLLKVIHINYLHEYIRFQVKLRDNLLSFMTPCRSSSKTRKFEILSDSFEVDLESAAQNNSVIVAILSESNIKSGNWNRTLKML